MTSVIVAFLLAAAPFCAAEDPASPAAYDRAYGELRAKARAAYLSRRPIDEAVPPLSLKKLAAAAAEPASRKKAVELAEAVQAVKTLQGASMLLKPDYKAKLEDLVRERLGAADGAGAGPRGGAEPPESILRAFQQRQLEGGKRAAGVMGGAGALRDGRSAQSFGPFIGGYAPAGVRPEEKLSAADFRPHYKAGPAHEVPSAAKEGEHAAGEHKPGLWSKVVDVAKTPLPGTAGWKEKFDGFSKKRIAEAERLDQEGAALLEKGGAMNTLMAGWNAAQGFGNRFVGLEPKTVARVGAVVAAGAAVTAVVVAAPVVGTAAVVMATAKVGVLAFTAYSGVNAAASLIREPDYANAGGLALNFVGAKYAGPIAEKAGHMTEKAILAVAGSRSAKIAVEGTAAAAGLAATPLIVRAAPLAAKVAAAETVATVRVAAETATHIAVEGAHEVGKETVIHSFARHEEHEPSRLAGAAGAGPFSASLPGH